ncbi:tRNA nucleotidyltransferase, partial [Candidatus Woesebacteria bacterium CG_4_10_14_0_2_um_filter_39_14]
KIDGCDVMKILRLRSGPRVGEILEKLFEKVVAKEIPNEREILLNKLSEMKNE